MCFWVRRCLEMPAFSLLATYISLLFHAVSLKYLFREKYGLRWMCTKKAISAGRFPKKLAQNHLLVIQLLATRKCDFEMRWQQIALESANSPIKFPPYSIIILLSRSSTESLLNFFHLAQQRFQAC